MLNRENTTFESLSKIYGEYTKDGVSYAITQYPYADDAGGETYFCASGFDRAGNGVRLHWEITNPETEDPSQACDWDEFEAYPNLYLAPWHPDYL